MMTFWNFIKNGGLCGLMSGFDNKKEGHAFNFKDLGQTVDEASKLADKIRQQLQSTKQLLK